MVPWLHAATSFPPLSRALREPNGLLAAGADLSPERLLGAYSRGIFPWFSDREPILWWSPDPRMVLVPGEFRLTRSLAKTLRNKPFEVRADTAFQAVMRACAEPRSGQGGTWINEQMISAYCRMHELGHAHSVETWHEAKLVGGLYGIALGRVFFGESMFARANDASKAAFAHLVRRLVEWDFALIDCQMNTPHLASLGAREIARAEFAARLAELVHFPAVTGPWTSWFPAASADTPHRAPT